MLLSKRTSSVSSSSVSKQHLMVETTSRSYQLQQQQQYQLQQQQQHASAAKESSSNHHRIAHWDKKREKCNNCNLIYLKTLSRHPGFCSVDCKSNAVYLQKVNRTIRAMKDAVEQRQQQEAACVVVAADEAQPVIEQEPEVEHETPESESASDSEEESDDRAAPCVHEPAHTFSEFGLESRILDASNVEWAFSALY